VVVKVLLPSGTSPLLELTQSIDPSAVGLLRTYDLKEEMNVVVFWYLMS
jgi:hypothetical protein